MKTKQIIIQAMMDLLQEESFQEITIQMILDRAGVSRSTFYRYFLDKYDIAGVFLENHLVRILDGYADANLETVFSDIFELFLEEENFFTKVYRMKGRNSLLDYLYQYLSDGMTKLYLTKTKKKELSEDEYYRLTSMISGQIYVIYRWFRKKNRETTEYMVSLMLDLIPAPFDVLK